MIVGHGDIAGAIPKELDAPGRLWFAAGVSHSGQTDEREYQREIALLHRQDRQRHIIYFSSLCVFYADTRYARHKRHLEYVIQTDWKHYTIVRLGNIDWGTNPHTLINHLRARYAAGLALDLQPVARYVVGLAEFQHWLALIPPWSCEMNIPGRRLTVAEIAAEYVTGEYAFA